MPTIDETLAEAIARLAAADVPEPRLDARVLTAAALRLTREALLAHGDAPVTPAAAAQLAAYVARRAAGEPVARILARKEFWSLEFEVTGDTLVPRPDSETLVEAALAIVPDRERPCSLLDFGTGTGCLLLALLSELPNARGVGVDLNPGAVAVARRNAARLGLDGRASFMTADFTADLSLSISTRFDIVLSNPPYIPDREIDHLAREVAQYEPRAALAGGGDGLDAYRALAPQMTRLLALDGHGFLEIGQGQEDRVAAIMAAAGLRLRARHADLAGIVRVLHLSPS